MAAPVVVALALVAHLWMFASHNGAAMDAHADVLTAVASVADPPVPMGTCAMTACTATPTEDPRLPPALLLSPLPVVLWVLRDRVATSRPRSRSSGEEPDPPLSPVACGVLLLE